MKSEVAGILAERGKTQEQEQKKCRNPSQHEKRPSSVQELGLSTGIEYWTSTTHGLSGNAFK
jgi:hypothetical protein